MRLQMAAISRGDMTASDRTSDGGPEDRAGSRCYWGAIPRVLGVRRVKPCFSCTLIRTDLIDDAGLETCPLIRARSLSCRSAEICALSSEWITTPSPVTV